MPIPILVAAGAALFSAVSAGLGVGVYKNNKHNKAKAEWQEEKERLQRKIEEYQIELKKREEKIAELSRRLKEKLEIINKLTDELNETDDMIEGLEIRQIELESFVEKIKAILFFRLKKYNVTKNEILLRISELNENKIGISNKISRNEESRQRCEEDLKTLEPERDYYIEEIAEINNRIYGG